jgi:hypothetical protein
MHKAQSNIFFIQRIPWSSLSSQILRRAPQLYQPTFRLNMSLPSTELKNKLICCVSSWLLFGTYTHFSPENGGDVCLWPVGLLSGAYMALCSRRHLFRIAAMRPSNHNRSFSFLAYKGSEYITEHIGLHAKMFPFGETSQFTSRYHQTTGDWDGICPSICPPYLMCKCSLDIVLAK